MVKAEADKAVDKLHIREAIVVEGRDDVDAVSKACDALIIATHGFGITGGVKNLFNKKYYDYQGKNSQTGIYEYSPANERNYYVEFKYTY